MQLQTVQLVLTVSYGFEDDPKSRPDERTCRQMMHDLVSHAANRGLLSGDHEFVVHEYDHEVVTLPHKAANVVKGTIKVPRCWKRLIDTMFDDDEDLNYVVQGTDHPVKGEKECAGESDPEPYYDDSRTVLGQTEDGGTIELDLCSGQSNYYGGCTIHDGEGNVVYETDMGDPLESLDDEEYFVGEDGNTYIITIEWEGDDPYENGYDQ